MPVTGVLMTGVVLVRVVVRLGHGSL
jgi:hypothetical protein